MGKPYLKIAIAPFLKSCPRLITLGVRGSLADYSHEEMRLMAAADRIFFPTPRFAKVLEAAGKETFPNTFTYSLRKSSLLQAAFFEFHGCPHPRSRIYFGRQKALIPSDFRYPFQAMGPETRNRARTIEDAEQLAEVVEKFNPLIVRENVLFEERFRLMFLNLECVAVLRDVSGDLSCPGPSASLSLYGWGLERFLSHVVGLVRSYKLNDIAVEIGFSRDRGWQLASLSRPPLSWQSPDGPVNRHEYIAALIMAGDL